MQRITISMALAILSGCVSLFTVSEYHIDRWTKPQPNSKTAVAGQRFPEPVLVESFEQSKPGPFNTLKTKQGLWQTVQGIAKIDDQHGKSGRQCLQLAGGDKTIVTLEIAPSVDTSGELSFWAERWTRREPFSFRIEKDSGQGWEALFTGDEAVLVGRAFLSHVRIPLNDKSIRRFRLTVTSPPNTGVLIDDIRFVPARPQKIVSVQCVPFTLPALVGKPFSPLCQLKITTSGNLDPITVTGLRGQVEGWEALQSLFFSSERAADNPQAIPLSEGLAATTNWKVQSQPLQDGVNLFWVGGQLKPTADIDQFLGASIDEVTFSNGVVERLSNPPSLQRMGVAVRQAGDQGVHTYRIPGLVTTNQGTLIGVYDIRHRSGGDLPGDIDVGMSRSTDGGKTWEPMRTIMDMGRDPNFRYDGIGDPAILVDRQRGTIWVAATWSHGNRSWRGSGPGLTPDETGQLMLVRSDDDGLTWSQPINITEQVKRPEWSFLLQGPGKGITMQDGTLVFPAQYQDPPENSRLPHSTLIYSKDHGETWQIGTGAFDDTTEAQVVEIEPGVLMLNCRYNRAATRVVMVTRDMGQTWEKHPSSERALIEPRACMASLIRVDEIDGGGKGSWLLFSNPDSTEGRHHISIKASPDRGLTWPKENRLLLDEGVGAGYSCLTMIDDETVGILYEGSQAHMTFQRIPLADLCGAAGARNETVPDPTARLTLAPVFGSHMVLQAESEIPVWGNALPNSRVVVKLGGDSRKTHANQKGEWFVRLPPQPIGGQPLNLTIESSEQSLQLKDILIGEVWLCSGQSNMAWPLERSGDGKQAVMAATDSQIRLFQWEGRLGGGAGAYPPHLLPSLKPSDFCQGEWQVADPESASSFSGVAWFFGEHLRKRLKVPVGLICVAVGGSPTEAWVPAEALQKEPNLRGLVAGYWLDNERLSDFCQTRANQNLTPAIQAGEDLPGDTLGPNHPFKPGFMWEAAISRLAPTAIRGVLWYQGESNAGSERRVLDQAALLQILIERWRSAWGMPSLPFFCVQLPGMRRTEWPRFREIQRRTIQKIAHAGMAVAIDVGHPTDVHPIHKRPVGERLARLALNQVYGRNDVVPMGPMLDNVIRQEDSILISFREIAEGLKSRDGEPLRHFEICGEDGVFRPATARLIAPHQIEVSNHFVGEPRHVRYAWQPFPEPPVNLVNSEGLPGSPFSTEPTKAIFSSADLRDRP